MKILALADKACPALWDHLDRRHLEGVELILACGDLPASYLSFLTCFTHAPILYVHGNHDTRYASDPPEGCVCVEDKIYVHKGLRILGLGGSMRYKPGEHQYSQEEMDRRIRKLRFQLWKHGGFDLLLSHAPAFGVDDSQDLCHTGFQGFTRLMDKYHPGFFVHGHTHMNYSIRNKRLAQYGSTLIINGYERYLFDTEAPPKAPPVPNQL